MAVNRVRDLRILMQQTLPFTSPVQVHYTAVWKAVERLTDPMVEPQTISGVVTLAATLDLIAIKDACMADILTKFGGNTIEENADLSPPPPE